VEDETCPEGARKGSDIKASQVGVWGGGMSERYSHGGQGVGGREGGGGHSAVG
jgi:hypothetical protein